MKFALYGKSLNSSFVRTLQSLLNYLAQKKIEILIFEPFYKFLKNSYKFDFPALNTFSAYTDLTENIKVIISIGGDGTFLETVSIIRDKAIPVLGLNTGRLGFLATISENDIQKAIDFIIKGKFTIEERTLLKLDENEFYNGYNYALNDITVQKSGSGLISIHAYLDGEFLNSYWADGLIIATPTGSTAYSLSVGGPVVLPQSGNFIVSPIAPHTLTVRPIVVPDHMNIKLKVDSRDADYIISLDHQSKILNKPFDIYISKADYKIKLLKLTDTSYYETLRNKLMWGMDKRN